MTLYLTCILALGATMTPPPGWTIEKVEHKPEVMWMEYTQPAQTRVTFSIDVKDLKITLPDGCDRSATVEIPTKKK